MGDVYEVEACTDCIMWIANGELPHDNPDNFDPDRIEANWSGWILALGGESLGFSHYGCECCGSHLGGDRYKLNAWKEANQTK